MKKKITHKIFFLFMVNTFFWLNLNADINEIFLLPSSIEESGLMTSLYSISQDINSIFYNPAGIAINNIKRFGLNYSILFDNIKSGSVILNFPTKKNNYSFGIKYNDLGDITFYNDYGEKLGVKNLYAYRINIGFGNELFISGLYLGISLGVQNIVLNKEYFLTTLNIGGIYIIPIQETEVHIGSNIGSQYNFVEKKVILTPSLGMKYFLPEYKSFVSLAYKIIDRTDFYSFGLELSFIKNINLILGYEISTQIKDWNNNFGIATKINLTKRQDFSIGFGYRTLNNLGNILSTSIEFRL